ncbi:Zinc transporter [Perkinsus chesapeaki]|uniref:Zinc transporter n=1 Tax=Perkinsus chesapeaki TaxID=330153 RepID=A0A7J6N1G7_PERCH|nr:Zinc transporter [Perkinsus chesapeaki]
MVAHSENTGLAIGLTCAAGGATMLGGLVSMFVDPHNHKFMAGSLALAAGVMVFVSYVEIFPEATELFQEGGKFDEDEAFMMTTLVYFLATLLSLVVDWASHKWHARGRHKQRNECNVLEATPEEGSDVDDDDDDPHGIAPAAVALQELAGGRHVNPMVSEDSTPEKYRHQVSSITDLSTNSGAVVIAESATPSAYHKLELLKVALFTTGAICLHNFPEGILTFIGTIKDPSVGVALAMAIAIHNIPEGIAVASPVLRATGSKKQAAFWCFISAVAEPLGGILAWLVLSEQLSTDAYAVMFALSAGVMVYIAITKLFITACHLDHSHIWCAGGFFAGAAIMAASLALFRI